MSFIATLNPPIQLGSDSITNEQLAIAADLVNNALKTAGSPVDGLTLDLYDVIDLRMLSGLIGEMFVSELCRICPALTKNPNIDGYPDLLDVSTEMSKAAIKTLRQEDYLRYPFGGLEVKNTFGVKKSKAEIPHRHTRLSNIQKTLVWKAHHRDTNNLIGLQSDYIDTIPQIVALFYSNTLEPSDWTIKQQPREGSTMTSFCQTQNSAFRKMREGIQCYRGGIGLEDFLSI